MGSSVKPPHQAAPSVAGDCGKCAGKVFSSAAMSADANESRQMRCEVMESGIETVGHHGAAEHVRRGPWKANEPCICPSPCLLMEMSEHVCLPASLPSRLSDSRCTLPMKANPRPWRKWLHVPVRRPAVSQANSFPSTLCIHARFFYQSPSLRLRRLPRRPLIIPPNRHPAANTTSVSARCSRTTSTGHCAIARTARTL